MTVDMGNLLKSEVDLKARTDKRKRIKTCEEKDVPEVNYKLWPANPETAQESFSDHATLALTSEDWLEAPWTNWIGEDGKEHEKNLIGLQWKKAHGRRQRGRKLRMRISAESVPFHRLHHHRQASGIRALLDCSIWAASPKSIADKHYVPRAEELFDEIIDWLGKEIGLANPESDCHLIFARPSSGQSPRSPCGSSARSQPGDRASNHRRSSRSSRRGLSIRRPAASILGGSRAKDVADHGGYGFVVEGIPLDPSLRKRKSHQSRGSLSRSASWLS